ncbi:hypothetical protein BJ912DRAFT_1063228 [Pholiota molesta]|nr:hypothetical protein BJ912DRAFT_1063228 [Pholiota molesta]
MAAAAEERLRATTRGLYRPADNVSLGTHARMSPPCPPLAAIPKFHTWNWLAGAGWMTGARYDGRTTDKRAHGGFASRVGLLLETPPLCQHNKANHPIHPSTSRIAEYRLTQAHRWQLFDLASMRQRVTEVAWEDGRDKSPVDAQSDTETTN